MAMDPVPWHVHVKEYYFDAWHGEHYKNLGGGTILNKNTVLTAATLVYTEEKKSFFVAPGVTNIDDHVKPQLQSSDIKIYHSSTFHENIP